MKFNFKKVATVLGTALMLGSTVGMAAAASYPMPFVQSGAANVAIVVGSNAALTDGLAATKVAGDLATELAAQTASGSTVTGATATGGDSYKLEKASTKFQFGLGMDDVDSSAIDDKELPTLLKDMVFEDNDNDEFDYKQTVTLANLSLNLFDDDDYKVDAPTVGFTVADGAQILNYTLDFTENPLWLDLDTADLTILGKTYYILSVGGVNSTLTLLDSATDTEINEGETETLTVGDKTYEVSAKITSSSQVKLTVNGETTNTLSNGQTQKLSDGSYVGIKEISYNSKESGISSVEFSIGKGKLVLANGEEVEINDEDIDNLVVTLTNSSDVNKIDTLTIKWAADNDLFITEDTSILMPGFEAVKLSFGGMTYPAEETFMLKADGDDKIMLKDFATKETTADVYLLNGDGGNFSLIGKDSNNKLATGNRYGFVNFTEGVDDYFVLSYVSGDEAESYFVRATNFDDSDYANGEITADFEYLVDGTWKDLDTAVNASDEVSIGSASFTVDWVSNETAKTVNLSVAGSNSFKKLISKEGLQLMLPWQNATVYNITNNTVYTAAEACTIAQRALGNGELGTKTVGYNITGLPTYANVTASCNATSFVLNFTEEDKNDAIAGGNTFQITVGLDSDLEVTISSIAGDTTAYEVGESEVFRSFVQSALATEIKDDQSGDHETVTITYHGAESFGNVFVLAPSATIAAGSGSTGGSATELGSVTVTDAEISSVSSKNLIVIGGSCINSVASTLLGGAGCGDSFTTKAGVNSGEALIKSFDRSGKVALLVAGYNAADTEKAATYLVNNAVNTSVGAALKVTSATQATAITA
jgi:hypothetical protein